MGRRIKPANGAEREDRGGSFLRNLLPRFLLVALVASGAWLWKSGRFVQTRELRWQVGEGRASVREVEIQLWNERGELLKREVFFFPDGAPPEIVQKVPLADGDYLARVFLKRSPDASSEQFTQTIHVSGSSILLSLRGAGGPR